MVVVFAFYSFVLRCIHAYAKHTDAIFIILTVVAAFAITYAGVQAGLHGGEASRSYALGMMHANQADTVYLDATLDKVIHGNDPEISEKTKREYQETSGIARGFIAQADEANAASDRFARITTQFGVITLLATIFNAITTKNNRRARIFMAMITVPLIIFCVQQLLALAALTPAAV